jgi:hypothetical protein
MSSESPTPPAKRQTDIVDTRDGISRDHPEHVARYAERLAAHTAREARLEVKSDDDGSDERPDDLPDGVRSKPTIAITERSDNRYSDCRGGEAIQCPPDIPSQSFPPGTAIAAVSSPDHTPRV